MESKIEHKIFKILDNLNKTFVKIKHLIKKFFYGIIIDTSTYTPIFKFLTFWIIKFGYLKNINIILSIIEGKSKISLRLIDWFVTNYCKKYTVRYYITNKNTNVLRMWKKYLQDQRLRYGGRLLLKNFLSGDI